MYFFPGGSKITRCHQAQNSWPPLHSCPMHTQPPLSLGLGLTVVEPFSSLRLQRWTSSVVPLLRSKLTSSLKGPALGAPLPAAISNPTLLPHEACEYRAIPRHHPTLCDVQHVQPSLTLEHIQSSEVSAQHCCVTGCSLPSPSGAISCC